MARSGGSRKSYSSGGRGASATSKRQFARTVTPGFEFFLPSTRVTRWADLDDRSAHRSYDPWPVPSLEQMEADLRQWYPEGFVPGPRTISGQPARIKVAPQRRTAPRSRFPRLTYPTHRLAFELPDRVIRCVKRKVRKQVMFAINKAGKGGGRPPRYNFWSFIGC